VCASLTGTRVGATNISDDPIKELSHIGKEFGTTTGRRRNAYWFDMDELDYALDICPCTKIALTKCDIIDNYIQAGHDHIHAIENGIPLIFESIEQFISYLKTKYNITYTSWSPDNILRREDDKANL